MQSNTFHIPSEESNQRRGQTGSAEVQPETPAEAARPTTHERLGQLGLDEGLRKITRNDENKEWPESSTENERMIMNIGGEIEKERNAIEENFRRAA